MKSFILWAIVFYVVFYLNIDTSIIKSHDRMTIDETEKFNAITLARLAGIFLITSIIEIIHSKKIFKILFIFIFFISLYWILVASTRATILGILLAIVLYFFINFKNNTKLAIQILLGSVILYFTFSFLIGTEQFAVFQRFSELQNYEEHKRYLDYLNTYAIMQEHFLFGLGPHGYQDIYERYPHSYLLEMISNFGLLGLISLLMVVSFGFLYVYQIFKNKHASKYDLLSALLWVYFTFSVFFSGDINVNRIFWILSGLLIISNNLLKYESAKIKKVLANNCNKKTL